MGESELIEVIFKVIDFINFEWNIHFGFAIAFIGWRISTNKSLSILVKLISTTVIILFSITNILTLLEYYQILDSLVEEYKIRCYVDNITSNKLKSLINNFSTTQYKNALWFIHIPIDLFLIVCAWLNTMWKNNKPN